MGKKQSESSARAKPQKKNARHIPDNKIDFSDVPELTDNQLAKARRVGRPKSESPKKLIAVRLSPELLAQIRKLAAKRGKPYQTIMHELLEKGVKAA